MQYTIGSPVSVIYQWLNLLITSVDVVQGLSIDRTVSWYCKTKDISMRYTRVFTAIVVKLFRGIQCLAYFFINVFALNGSVGVNRAESVSRYLN